MARQQLESQGYSLVIIPKVVEVPLGHGRLTKGEDQRPPCLAGAKTFDLWTKHNCGTIDMLERLLVATRLVWPTARRR